MMHHDFFTVNPVLRQWHENRQRIKSTFVKLNLNEVSTCQINVLTPLHSGNWTGSALKQRRPCPDMYKFMVKNIIIDIEPKGQGHTEVMNIYICLVVPL